MEKKIQDLKPDTVLKNYWNNKEQFADLFNAVLFQGRCVIRAEEHIHYAMPMRIMGYDYGVYKNSMTATGKSIRQRRGWKGTNICPE